MYSQIPSYTLLNVENTSNMLKDFSGERTGWVQVGEKKWLFPYRYTEQGKGFYEFKARPTDTWVLSFPRSGTTWMQELVWLVANDMDFHTANTNFLTERFPFLEFSLFNHPDLTEEFLEFNKGKPEKQDFCKKLAKPGYEVLENMQSPRFIKSHFPFSLLPQILNSGCKIIYIARNPKNVVVSWYKLNQAFKTQGFNGDFMKFWIYFRNDLTPWSPYWEHLKEAWENRNNPNLLFVFYEELQQNLLEVIGKVSKFLGKSYTREQIAKLQNHLNIKNFRNNCMVNSQELKDCGIIKDGFEIIRKGINGSLKDYFTEELNYEADKWIETNLMKYDLPFSYK